MAKNTGKGTRVGSVADRTQVKNPVTGDPEQVAVNHGTGFIFKTAECASAREGAVAIEEMNFSYPDKAGFVARIRYGN